MEDSIKHKLNQMYEQRLELKVEQQEVEEYESVVKRGVS
jgi:hypothetical protein